jgi:NDP-sugar pyrophosphorylase family protein
MKCEKNKFRTSQYDSILLCGGKGTRIESITSEQGNIPKPLLEVNGIPLLRHTIELMGRRAVSQLVFAVGHKAEQVEDWVRSEELEHDIAFTRQTEPGVLNAVVSAIPSTHGEKVIVSNTDEIRYGFDLKDALEFHESTPQSATLITAHTNQLARHRVVTTNHEGVVTSTEKQPVRYLDSPESVGVVNAGMIISDADTILSHADGERDRDWGGILDALVEAGQLAAYQNKQMAFFNVGTPEEYAEAQEFLRAQKAA